jgi:hypothetical protein
MDGQENKREFTRVPVQVPIEVQAGDRTFRGLLTGNLSMKGLLVGTPEVLPEGTGCTLRILLGDGTVEVRAEAQVARIYPGALALQFTRILGTESFEHLRQLVLYNSKDPEQIEHEFHEHAGIKPKR